MGFASSLPHKTDTRKPKMKAAALLSAFLVTGSQAWINILDGIKGYRVSCESDTFHAGEYDYAGVLVYDVGSYRGIYSGYTTFFSISKSRNNKYKAWARKNGMKFSGFVIKGDKVEFDLGTRGYLSVNEI